MGPLRIAATLWFCLPPLLIGQTATPPPPPPPPPETAFLTTVGTDTFCLEQYRRTGNIISGTWVVLHPPGVFVHDYRITLGTGGLPERYVMKYSTPGAATAPDLDSLTVVYGRDSANVQFFTRDSSFTRRIALHEGFPLLGQSYVGLELALLRLRKMHVDSSVIALHPPSDPAGQVRLASVRFFGGDSALVAGSMRLRIGADGRILGLRAGPRELRRVEAFNMSTVVDGFVKTFAPRVAALAAAAAARVEISLPAAQLERFVGTYSMEAGTIEITRDSDHLVLHVPPRLVITLLAMSPTEFFVRQPDLVLAFASDSTGRVTGLTVQQGETKQRFARQ